MRSRSAASLASRQRSLAPVGRSTGWCSSRLPAAEVHGGSWRSRNGWSIVWLARSSGSLSTVVGTGPGEAAVDPGRPGSTGAVRERLGLGASSGWSDADPNSPGAISVASSGPAAVSGPSVVPGPSETGPRPSFVLGPSGTGPGPFVPGPSSIGPGPSVVPGSPGTGPGSSTVAEESGVASTACSVAASTGTGPGPSGATASGPASALPAVPGPAAGS